MTAWRAAWLEAEDPVAFAKAWPREAAVDQEPGDTCSAHEPANGVRA